MTHQKTLRENSFGRGVLELGARGNFFERHGRFAKFLNAQPNQIKRAEFKDTTTKGIFTQGFLVSQTNPKGLIFLLAVLPQFVDATQPVAMQYVILTLTLNIVDLIAMGCYTAFAAKVLMMLKDPEHIRWTNRGIGSLFVAAGVALAVFKKS